MASERERAKEEYLVIREQALKMDKKVSIAKMLSDILYMLCGGVIIAAFITMFSMWTQLSGGQVALYIALFAVGFIVMVVLASMMSRVMLGRKKILHDLKQKLEDLESKYHL